MTVLGTRTGEIPKVSARNFTSKHFLVRIKSCSLFRVKTPSSLTHVAVFLFFFFSLCFGILATPPVMNLSGLYGSKN